MQNTLSIYELTTEFYQSLNKYQVWHASECTSTNDLAKEPQFINQSNPQIFITDYQSQGRGQWDRRWMNADLRGQQLLATWSWPWPVAPQPHYTLVIGLALAKALQHTWPSIAIGIKRPNDLYLKQKKWGGVLTESIQQGESFRLIFGIGLNIFSAPNLDLATFLFADTPASDPLRKGAAGDFKASWSLFLTQFHLHLNHDLVANEKTWLPDYEKQLQNWDWA